MSEPQSVPAQRPDPAQRPAPTPAEGSGRALVLSGGGIKGAYQIGAIVEVIASGFRPNAIFGISIGALNGGVLASYVGEQIRAGESPDFLSAARKLEKYWCDNVTDFTKLGHKRSTLELLWEAWIGDFRGMIDMDGVIDIVKKEIRPENLRAAANAGLRFFAGTLNLTEGKYVNAEVNAEEIKDQIVEYVIASGMQPIVMPMHVIPPGPKPLTFLQQIKEFILSKKPPHVDDENSWVDGGVQNVTPINPAITEGYKDILCIICRPVAPLKRGSFRGRVIAISDRLSDVVTQEVMIKDMERILKINQWVDTIQNGAAKSEFDREFLKEFSKINLRIIHPEHDLGVDLQHFTQDDIEMMIEKGHRDAAAEISRQSPRRRMPDKKLGERAPSTKPSAWEPPRDGR